MNIIYKALTHQYHKVAVAVACLFCSSLMAAPFVSNIRAIQRPGTGMVDITYDLTAETPVAITLRISSDGGTTFGVLGSSLSGACGKVTMGNGKIMTWDAGADWLGNYNTSMRFEITADSSHFSLIPGGFFTMGRSPSDEVYIAPTATNVNVSQFSIGKFEITKAEWDEVRAWALLNGYTDLAIGGGKESNHPVQGVSWWDAIKWCNAKSQREGLTPCYSLNGSVMKTGEFNPSVDWSSSGYRLPTEAEWEKAARGGVNGKSFPWGTNFISHVNANFKNSGTTIYQTGTTGDHPTYKIGDWPYTAPVGSFAANGYGLYDMAGNISEWCWDWFDINTTYVNGSTDPRGTSSGQYKVARGGSWFDGAEFTCHVAYRGSNVLKPIPGLGNGFRLACRSFQQNQTNSGLSESILLDTRYRSLTTSTNPNGSIEGGGDKLL